MCAREVAVPVRPDHEQPQRLGGADHMLQEQQLRRASPLQVVEDEHDRALPRRGREQPRHRLEQEESFGLGLRHLRRGHVRNPRGQLGHEAGELAAMGRDVSGQDLGGRVRHVVSKGLDEGPERKPHVFVAAAEEHDPALGMRAARGLGRQPGLADARLARQQHDLPLAIRAFAHASASVSASALRPNIANGDRLPSRGGSGIPAAAIGSHATAQVVTGSGRPFKATGPIGLKV